MILNDTKQALQRFVEFINTANMELGNELISTNATFYVPGNPEPMRGPAGYIAIIEMMRGGFPDIQWSLDDIIAEGDKVAARLTMCGTHKNLFFGIPATGKSIEVKAINFYRFANGQIVEEHGMPDMFGLLHQMGAKF